MTAIRSAVAAHVRQRWPELSIVAAALAVVVLFDIALVELGYRSLTVRVWSACDAHPMIAVGGMLGTVYGCYRLRRSWPSVMVGALVGAHLFTAV